MPYLSHKRMILLSGMPVWTMAVIPAAWALLQALQREQSGIGSEHGALRTAGPPAQRQSGAPAYDWSVPVPIPHVSNSVPTTTALECACLATL